ncbi:hypothetical protein TrRE_jg10455, partial [Triparma retinervis]
SGGVGGGGEGEEEGEGETKVPKRREIVVPEKKRTPSLKDIKEKEKKEKRKGRGFRNSFNQSVQKLLGVEEFGPKEDLKGKYPDKIVKRLRGEAKRIAAPGFKLPSSVLSLAPEESRNTHDVHVFWMGSVAGPPGTIYHQSTMPVELFVSPEYPFKGPTLQFEGHVVEFCVGENQVDPREKGYRWKWTPAMTLVDA